MSQQIIVTNQQAAEFVNVAKEFLNNKERKTSTLTYALMRTLKRAEPLVEDFKERVGDLEAKYQSKDEHGVFEFHDKDCKLPKFTAENHGKFRAEFNKLKRQEVSLMAIHAEIVPEDLELIWYQYFVPFVIADYPGAPPEPAEEA